MAKTYIPTPEEIQARWAAAAEGRQVPSGKEMAGVVAKVAELEKKVTKKRTAAELRAALDLLMEKYDFSPAEELVKMATSQEPDGRFTLDVVTGGPEKRIHVLETLLEYTMPKLKSVEVSGTVEHDHTIHIVRYGDDGVVTKETLLNPPSTGNSPARQVEAGPRPVTHHDIEVKVEKQ